MPSDETNKVDAVQLNKKLESQVKQNNVLTETHLEDLSQRVAKTEKTAANVIKTINNRISAMSQQWAEHCARTNSENKEIEEILDDLRKEQNLGDLESDPNAENWSATAASLKEKVELLSTMAGQAVSLHKTAAEHNRKLREASEKMDSLVERYLKLERAVKPPTELEMRTESIRTIISSLDGLDEFSNLESTSPEMKARSKILAKELRLYLQSLPDLECRPIPGQFGELNPDDTELFVNFSNCSGTSSPYGHLSLSSSASAESMITASAGSNSSVSAETAISIGSSVNTAIEPAADV